MESSRHDDALLAALEALRPSPDPAFAAALDERAAAGFPRREDSAAAPWARLAAWLRELKPRQVLLPAAATGLVAVLVATVVVAGSNTGGGGALQDQVTSSSGAMSEEMSTSSSAEAGGAEEATAEVEEAGGGGAAADATAAPKAESAPSFPSSSAANAAPTPHRSIERSSQIVLGAAPGELSDAAGKVFEAVHAARGIVLHSSVQDGTEGEAEASFSLLIPSAQLDDALGSFSEIGEVLSRRDGTADITAPTVGASERLQDSRARIDGLLNELAASETEIERETLEAELRAERNRSAVLRSQLQSLQHRAAYSRVSLRIEGDESASSGGGGGWDVGDAAGDAGHILAVAAGVALVGLAVLAPIALLVLLGWLGHRAWVQMARRRALG